MAAGQTESLRLSTAGHVIARSDARFCRCEKKQKPVLSVELLEGAKKLTPGPYCLWASASGPPNF
jgi:hypothetical protein